MIRYVSPVNPAVYPHLAITLLVIGLFFTAWFFVYPHHINLSFHNPLSLHCIVGFCYTLTILKLAEAGGALDFPAM